MTPIDQIADILRTCQGRESAITSKQIAERMGLPPSADRTIRQAIADEDWESREMLVVGFPGIGFYVADDVSECQAYHVWLSMLAETAAAKVTTFFNQCRKSGITLQKP